MKLITQGCFNTAVRQQRSRIASPKIVAFLTTHRAVIPSLTNSACNSLKASHNTGFTSRPLFTTCSATTQSHFGSSSTVYIRSQGFQASAYLNHKPVAYLVRRSHSRTAIVCLAAMASSPSNASGTGSGKGKRMVLWFRNDLRLHDNYVVHQAVTAIKQKQYDEVLPLYIYDPRCFKISLWGNPKVGVHRGKFLHESVADLKARLRDIGSDLLVAVGQPEEVIPKLLADCASSLVLTMDETTSEELKIDARVNQALKPVNGRVQRVWGHTLYHLDDLQAENGPFPTSRGGVHVMPDVFTPFKEKVEKRVEVRREVPTPQKGSLPLPSAALLYDLPTPATTAAPSRPANLLEAAAMAYQNVPGGVPASIAAAPASPSAHTRKASLQDLLAWEPSWEQLPWPKETGVPAQPVADPRAVLNFKGGESVALDRLKYYLWDSDLIATYFDTAVSILGSRILQRNGMLGGDYSTKFSPWLAVGCLSPRTIYHNIRKYEQQRTANKSTYWVIFELIWRDFFKFFSIKHGSRIFFEYGTTGMPLTWNNDPELWQRWRDGKTGLPLVDANMRELATTGFMSNRGRQNVASHLVLDLGVDWRRGADWFESCLSDYDVTSNWGNWVSAAGLTGGRLNLFNITKQSKDYDLNGDYIRTWVPELKNVPASRIHEPWLMSKEEQAKYGVQIGVDYPNPIHSSRYGRPHSNKAGNTGNDRYGNGAKAYASGGGGRGRGGSGGRGGGGGGRGGGRGNRSRQSDFERFG